MNIKLLTEHHLEFLRLKMGCRGLSESTLVKMPHCWKSHVAAQIEPPYSGKLSRARTALIDDLAGDLALFFML